MEKKSLAIIGAGVSGIVAAYLLQEKYDVTLYEKNAEIGGHTNTFVIKDGPDAGAAIDTGFIVLNDKTYPLFHKFLKELNVPVRYSDMSFGFYCERTGVQYSGRGLSGLFADRRNILSPSHLSFLMEIRKFCTRASDDLRNENLDPGMKLEDYLRLNGFSQKMIFDYIVPMGAAIWSAPDAAMLQFPALTFIQFFSNHGLLSLKDRPRWQTVVGGSHSYLKAFKGSFKGKLITSADVKSIERESAKVRIKIGDSYQEHDLLILAVHADQASRLLERKNNSEEAMLNCWSYQKNHTVLHSDISFLPPLPMAQASWNYRRELTSEATAPLSVTYDMNRLQGLKTLRHYLVTLNSRRQIDKSHIHYEIVYEHPVFDCGAVASQQVLREQKGEQNTWFCGSYMGYGFHEDAVNAAAHVARSLGAEW